MEPTTNTFILGSSSGSGITCMENTCSTSTVPIYGTTTATAYQPAYQLQQTETHYMWDLFAVIGLIVLTGAGGVIIFAGVELVKSIIKSDDRLDAVEKRLGKLETPPPKRKRS
jgi:hypothetical protein